MRPKFPSDAKRAYCVAEKACPVSKVKNETNATVEKAVVKLSTIIVARNRVSLGPVLAIHANIRLLPAIAIPPIISPRTMPNFTLKILPSKVKKIVAPQPINLE